RFARVCGAAVGRGVFCNWGGGEMNAAPNPRLDELFVRYWDKALSQAEANELEALPAKDPVARGWVQILRGQAVVAAELPKVPGSTPVVEPAVTSPKPPRDSRRWSRRRALGFLGGTIAASLGAGLLGYSWWRTNCDASLARQVRISESKGSAMIRT